MIKTLGMLACVAFALPACGSDSPCEEYVDRLCEEACACGGGTCTIGDLADPNSVVSLTFDSVDDCIALNSLGCLSEDEGPDFSVCISELDQASCQIGGNNAYLIPECS